MERYRDLLAQKEQLEKLIAEAHKKEAGAALERVREAVAEFGFTPEDVFGKRRGNTRRAAAPKYRNPETGETWSASALPNERSQYGIGKARIYLAGFDVFRVDALDYGRSLQRMCADAGFEGLYPLDALAPADLSPQEKAAWIYRSNLAAIGRAEIVMANVADFRGVGEPDSGTAFEVGFAAALGRPIWAYREDLTALRERVPRSVRARQRSSTAVLPSPCVQSPTPMGVVDSSSSRRPNGGSEIRQV